MREDIYITSHKFGKEFYIRVEDFRDVVNKIQDKYRDVEEENKKLREEVEQLKNQRIFNSAEYDLITLTPTTPQWELRRK